MNKTIYVLKPDGGNFTLPVRDPPYLIIVGNCQGNIKLINRVINGGKPPTPLNSTPVYYN